MNSRRYAIVTTPAADTLGGTGTVDAAFLTEQTDLVERRQKLHLLGEEDNAEGKTVQIQVSNAEVMEEYTPPVSWPRSILLLPAGCPCCQMSR